MPTRVHKVFVSYHHDNDQAYRNNFENILSNAGIAVVRSVQMGDIDPDNDTDTVRRIIREQFLSDSTVTIVLVGTETWKRKHVDWEISYSLRETSISQRSGLVGIVLPTHPAFYAQTYDPNSVPPRLHDNVECRYAKIYKWTTSPSEIQDIIHDAFENRYRTNPNNTRPLYRNNRS